MAVRTEVKGIRREPNGHWRAYVQVGDTPKHRRFKPDTSLKTMQAWREEAKVALRKGQTAGVQPGSLAEDIARYLLLVAAMPTISQRTQHLEKWADELGEDTPRSDITASDIRSVLQQWRQTLDPATCNKRRTALMHLWSVLDGKGARNPVRDVPKFRVADSLPRGRDIHTIDKALKAAPKCRSRACCRVMLWTGARPCELQIATPDDIDLAQKIAIIRTAKGGRTRVIPLTDQAVQAWKEFAAAGCWQDVPQAAPLGRWLKAHTAIDDLRVYDLRHTYGTALARRETRLDVIASLMGHSTLELTRRYTLAAVTPDALAATSRLGRKR